MSAISSPASKIRRLFALPVLFVHILAGVFIANGLCFFAPKIVVRRFVIDWMRVLLRLLRVKIVLHGQFASAPVLMVANHVSWLDIPVLLTMAQPDMVSKKELRHWPFVGWPAEKMGTLFLARGDSEDSRLLSNQIAFFLTQGRKIAIFPEGTTTNGRTVKRFYPRLFQAAIYAKMPIQPVAICYTDQQNRLHDQAPFIGDDDLLSHLWRFLGSDRATVHVHALPPLSTIESSRRLLADKAQHAILNVLATYWHEPTQRHLP